MCDDETKMQHHPAYAACLTRYTMGDSAVYLIDTEEKNERYELGLELIPRDAFPDGPSPEDTNKEARCAQQRNVSTEGG